MHKKLSVSDHKECVVRLIKNSCFENKEHFELESFDLVENVDYTLNIDLDQNNNVTASMKCKCDKSISSGKNYRKIQVSNYYRHLQSAGCFHINSMKKALRYVTAVQQQSSTSIVSLSSNQAPASSIEAPISSLARPLVISDQPVLNGKRRLASKSRQHSPKRSCT